MLVINPLHTILVGDQHYALWERSGVFQLELKCVDYNSRNGLQVRSNGVKLIDVITWLKTS